MNKVSVIIPMYNAQKYISRCIDSILNQTYENYELLLVDDCSEDNTLSICQEYAAKDTRIKILKQEQNTGVSTARNLGIQNATGIFIAFVDSDDWVHKDYLNNMIKPMLAEDFDLVCCSHINKNKENEQKDYFEQEEKILSNKEAIIGLFQNRYVQPAVWGKIFKLSIIQKNHIKFESDIAISEDIKLVYEYLTYANKCFVLNQALYWYVIDNMNSAMNATHKCENFQKKWLSAWTAYERMTRHTEEHFIKDVEVKRAFYAAKTCTARMKLHLMQEFHYYDAFYYHEMKQTIRGNIRDYIKYDYSNNKRKMMMLLCCISPKIEFGIWRCLAKD